MFSLYRSPNNLCQWIDGSRATSVTNTIFNVFATVMTMTTDKWIFTAVGAVFRPPNTCFSFSAITICLRSIHAGFVAIGSRQFLRIERRKQSISITFVCIYFVGRRRWRSSRLLPKTLYFLLAVIAVCVNNNDSSNNEIKYKYSVVRQGSQLTMRERNRFVTTTTTTTSAARRFDSVLPNTVCRIVSMAGQRRS